MSINFDEILLELSYRIPEGIVDLTKEHQVKELAKVLSEYGFRDSVRLAKEAGDKFSDLSKADKEKKSDMAKQAADMGLVHKGQGYYSKGENGEIAYKSDTTSGKIVPLTPDEKARINKGEQPAEKEKTTQTPQQKLPTATKQKAGTTPATTKATTQTPGQPQGGEQPMQEPAGKIPPSEFKTDAENKVERGDVGLLNLKPDEVAKRVELLDTIIRKDFPADLKASLGETGINSLKSAFSKMIGDEALSNSEKELLRQFVTRKEKEGIAALYIATKIPGDFKKHKKIVLPSSKADALKDLTQSLGMGTAKAQEGLMARKEVVANKVTSARKTIVTEQNADGSITIEGVVHKPLPIPDETQLAAELKKNGIENAENEAKTTIASLKRYNRQLEMMKAANKFEVVDFGDTTTPEGRAKTFDNFKQSYVNKFTEIFQRSETGLKPEDDAILQKLQNISFPQQNGDTEHFEKELDNLLGAMTLNKDFRTAVPDLLEGIVFCKMLGRGYHAFLPSSETFKVSDVMAFKEPNLKLQKGVPPAKQIADNFKMIKTTLVMVGGQSVKFAEGGAGQSDAKVDQTEYKHKETKGILKSLLSNYQFVYGKGKEGGYPPSIDAIVNKETEINNHLQWALNNGVLSKDDHKYILAQADKQAEGAFQTAMRNGVGPLSDEEKANYKRLLRLHTLSGASVETINNRDTDFNYFSNERSRVNERTGEVTNEELDGVTRKCCMGWSYNPGMKFSTYNGKKWMTPGNVNTSHIIPCDKKKR